jgi:hypothetical protein
MRLAASSLLLFSLLVCFSVPFKFSRSVTAQTLPASPQQVERLRQMLKAEARGFDSFARAREVLRSKGVPFDPDWLRHPQWREKLAPALSRMPEMRRAVRGGGRLNSAVFADTLYLPGRVELDGDAVLLVRNLVFEGGDVLIKGHHDLHVFVVDSVGTLGPAPQSAAVGRGLSRASAFGPSSLTLRPLQEGRITIDVSGDGRAEWLQRHDEQASRRAGVRDASFSMQSQDVSVYEPGATGPTGKIGAPALDGEPNPAARGVDGVCAVNPHGGNGVAPNDGGSGNKGRKGGRGVDGGDAGTIDLSLPANAPTNLVFKANGGQGGQGGQGGPGSPGGLGATGGAGGDGMDCTCQQLGPGIGGDGQNGGKGGRGGDGGDGGPGGRGGKGGTITITYQPGYGGGRAIVFVYEVTGGKPGPGGESGVPGRPGVSGEGGAMGHTHGNTKCPRIGTRNGRAGLQSGSRGWGDWGDWGPEGEHGPDGTGSVTQASGSDECEGEGIQNRDGDTISQQSDTGTAPCASPVLVDLDGDGFDLTDLGGGVRFDLNSNGSRERVSWTSGDSDDAWLALDRDGDGTIDDGRELFGNFTPQRPSSQPNGFRALAELDDRAENGGPGDGVIDRRDAVFALLMLWRDANHDGVSQPAELKPLSQSGVVSISLDYKESKRADAYGNLFRFRAKVGDGRGAGAGRWAWDVFVQSAP